MDLEIRHPGSDELEPLLRTCEAAFHDEFHPADLPALSGIVELDRFLCAFDEDVMVGTAGAFRFDMTIPGGELPTAGVTMVGVLPSHRRKGILTGLMRKQLHDAKSLGEPIAALWASEASIYARYGYGLGSKQVAFDIARDRATFRDPSRTDSRVRMITRDEAIKAFPSIYDRVRRVTPGFFTRTTEWWGGHTLYDPEHHRRGGSQLYCALLEIDGRAEGYASYRFLEDWDLVPKSAVKVVEAMATSPAATRELWHFLFGIDLAERVMSKFPSLPVDHLLFTALNESKRLQWWVSDALWLRIVDLEAALGARSFTGRGTLVVEVGDGLCPWNAGRWRLNASPEGGRLTPTSDDVDLVLDIRDLGAAYLGGVSFGEMVRAGAVVEGRPRAAFDADGLFRTERAPWCSEIF